MAKVAGKDLVFQIGSPLATLGIFDLGIDESADEIDVTDSESASDSREYLSGFIGRTLSYSRWYSDTTTPVEVGDEENFSVTLGAKAFTGTVRVLGRTVSASREDATRYDYTGRVTGALTFS